MEHDRWDDLQLLERIRGRLQVAPRQVQIDGCVREVRTRAAITGGVELTRLSRFGHTFYQGHAKRSVVPFTCAARDRRRRLRAVDRDAAVDAKNAPTAA